MNFEDVIYWNELTRIIDWSKTNVRSTLYICWGAQAGLYYNYHINKVLLDDKKFGVFDHKIIDKNSNILKGFEEGFKAPHSRHTTIEKSEIEKHPELTIVSESNDDIEETPIFSWKENGDKMYSNWVNYYLS